jgi:hypothetical protein
MNRQQRTEDERKKKKGIVSPQSLLLKTLEDMLYNRIKQKKGEMHKSQNRAYTDSLLTEIEILQWVLAEFYYQKTTRGQVKRYYY